MSFNHNSTIPEYAYRKLLRRTLIAVGVCVLAVLVCYFWVDRPVAFFVNRHHINTVRAFRWLTYPPPEVQNWSALVLTILVIRRAWAPFSLWQKALLVACVSLIVADDFRISLGDVFGRYWPETWTHDNPSLIGTGAYGFHPFQRGDDVSFLKRFARGNQANPDFTLANGDYRLDVGEEAYYASASG